MKKINFSDLRCLWFDCTDGVADWNIQPHPRVWGSNPELLPLVLRLCPDPRRLAVVLLATHLVYPQHTPIWAIPWLVQIAPELLGTELKSLTCARWRLISVPVAAGAAGRLHTVMIGTGDVLPDCSSWNARILTKDAQHAVAVVQRLVRLRTRLDSCYLFLDGITTHALIEGESLGLPCYLGALSAAEDLPCDFILATGRLNEDGRVLPVECLNQKLDVAGDGFRLFLYPEGCATPESAEAECVPVMNVREAADVAACFRPGLGLKIAHAGRVLLSGQGMAREICSFSSEMATWIRRNRDQVSQALQHDSRLEELVSQLKKWTDSTLRLDMDLGNAVLECLSEECARTRTGLTAHTAWDICALQIEKANHNGNLDSIRIWTNIAETLRPHIVQHDDCVRMLVLYDTLKSIGSKHNRYEFLDSIKDDHSSEEIRELEDAHARLCSRRGPCSNIALGKYYGTLGQYYGFMGPAFLDQTMEYLNRAIDCFHGDEIAMRQERDRDRLYQVFALSSAGRSDDAEDILRNLDKIWLNESWNVPGMNPYQIHALLRLHTDAEVSINAETWAEVYNTWQQEKSGHPSQLISYNLGLLAPSLTTAVDMLQRSAAQCLDAASGPTIRVMALLPLARLHTLEFGLNLKNQVNEAMTPILTGTLSKNHFNRLLTRTDWKSVLTTVSVLRTELFPFSYR